VNFAKDKTGSTGGQKKERKVQGMCGDISNKTNLHFDVQIKHNHIEVV